jgi:hypothetical protein
MKYSEYTTENKTIINREIDERFVLLRQYLEEAETKAIRFLISVNAGGAVTLLSFMGASESVRGLLTIKIALSLFVTGIILCGILLAIAYHFQGKLFESYRKDIDSLRRDDIEWQEMIDRDCNRSEPPWYGVPIGYIAFGCFIVGSVLGLCQLFSFQ